jgi:hypothetical protein
VVLEDGECARVLAVLLEGGDELAEQRAGVRDQFQRAPAA